MWSLVRESPRCPWSATFPKMINISSTKKKYVDNYSTYFFSRRNIVRYCALLISTLQGEPPWHSFISQNVDLYHLIKIPKKNRNLWVLKVSRVIEIQIRRIRRRESQYQGGSSSVRHKNESVNAAISSVSFVLGKFSCSCFCQVLSEPPTRQTFVFVACVTGGF